jgi:ABC-type multidrug transport system ATPase subunit
MGPTGAGKTILMNALSGQLTPDLVMTGEKRVNGRTIKTSGTGIIGFVPLVDHMNGYLTVNQTFDFAAKLMLSDKTDEEREARITEVLVSLSINHVRDVLIGTPLLKGISGGQRKRVSIGLALLTDPKLLILDEPTAGLDSVTAMQLLELLKELGDEGRTIVSVIHQPQRAIFELLDKLMLIRSGEIIYNGPASECIPYMTSLGIAYDGISNPADHILEVISPAPAETKEMIQERCLMRKAYQSPVIDLEENSNLPDFPMMVTAPWMSQFKALATRKMQEESKKLSHYITTFCTTVICAVVIGGVYWNLGHEQKSIRLRWAHLFFCVVNQSLFSAMQIITSFADERPLMLKERKANMYKVSAYIFTYSLVDIIHSIPWPFIFSAIVMPMVGPTPTAANYFLFGFILYMDKICATSLALFICCVAKNANLSTMILPLCLELSRLFSGYFLSPKLLPVYFAWLDPLSYVKYAYIAITRLMLTDFELVCPLKNQTRVCDSKLPVSGNALIVSEGVDYITIGECIGCLIGYALLMRFGAYVATRLNKW